MKSEVTLAKCHEIETKKATHVAFLFVTPGGSGKNLAEWTGLEPATPGVTGRYSNQLNYHSRTRLLIRIGWWVLTGSNRRHSPCKGDALPTELSTR